MLQGKWIQNYLIYKLFGSVLALLLEKGRECPFFFACSFPPSLSEVKWKLQSDQPRLVQKYLTDTQSEPTFW